MAASVVTRRLASRGGTARERAMAGMSIVAAAAQPSKVFGPASARKRVERKNPARRVQVWQEIVHREALRADGARDRQTTARETSGPSGHSRS